MITVGIYVRVSTQEQAQEGYSIGEQTERLQQYCQAMSWTVYKVYTDPGYSGGSMDRPALQQLIQDVKQHRINKVLVYKLDRLSRSQKDTLSLIEDVFNRNNTDFVSMMENFDTSTPFGRAAIGILAVFAQLEREQIKERMAMGKEARAKTGKWMGSYHIPIGYDYENGNLIINEYEKMQVLNIYDKFLSGSSIKKIVRDMISAGYKHKYGIWCDRTVRRVLASKTYLGYNFFKGEYRKSDHDPIISEDMYLKAQDLIKTRAELFSKNVRPGKATSYLSGLLYCGKCGAKYSRVNGSTYSYYYCASRHKHTPNMIKDPNCKNKNWRMDRLDEIIFDQIRQLVLDPDHGPSETLESDNTEILIQGEIEKIDGQISRYLDLYGLDQIPNTVLQKKIEDLNNQRSSLVKTLEDIPHKPDRSDMENIINSFSDVIEKGSFEEIRTVLFTLIDKIILDGENIEIHWKFN